MRTETPSPAKPNSTLERYLTFLGTPYTSDEGKLRQPASNKFIGALRAVSRENIPRFDLQARLAGEDAKFTGRVWFWSDLHLFHANVIRYCERPFDNATAMNAALLNNCLSRVANDDILVFGGDITMGGAGVTNELLRQIPCYKINVLGNHDTERKGKLLQLAVDEVASHLELVVNGQSFLITHYPIAETAMLPGQINIHGHIHNQAVHSSLGSGSRHINISVEHTEYAPVSLEWLLSRPR